jgi:phosphoribosylformylglycinamidine synthase
MGSVPILVLRTAGINCDEEISHAWRIAGAEPSLLHLNELTAKPDRLGEFAILTIPGGFSYGDDIAAGKILAERIELGLAAQLHEFVERGGGVFGVCNGFQVLVKMGLLPGGKWRDRVSVTNNDSAKFEARWVRLQPATDRCPFLPKDRAVLELPVEHAEGKVVTAANDAADELLRGGFVALRYVDEHGRHDTYPANPNGSVLGIAGLCDVSGRVFGLMPHPDRFFDVTQHPQWTSRKVAEPADGLAIFQAAVAHWR